MSYDESKAKDLLFTIDGSRSMNDKVKASGMRKIEIAKQGIMSFVAARWPVSYFPWPLRIGICFYRLLGTPGATQMELVVPLNPAPASLELYRLEGMTCKGGSPLADALRYSMAAMSDSQRAQKMVKLVSDGGNDGEPARNLEGELRAARVPIDAIELSNSASQELRDVATMTGGKYYRPNSLAEFVAAIEA